MAQPILAATRIVRTGSKILGNIVLTDATAAEDAEMSRGLFLGNCRENRLTSHLCYVVRNALPWKSVIATLSYVEAEEIADAFRTDHDIEVWESTQKGRTGNGDPAAPVQVAVLEKLFLVDKRVRTGEFDPRFIHMIGMSARFGYPHLRVTRDFMRRLRNLARHKAVCHAKGINPYVILWTPRRCEELPAARLGSAIGVEAWFYANGCSLRTAAFAAPETMERTIRAWDASQAG